MPLHWISGGGRSLARLIRSTVPPTTCIAHSVQATPTSCEVFDANQLQLLKDTFYTGIASFTNSEILTLLAWQQKWGAPSASSDPSVDGSDLLCDPRKTIIRLCFK